MPRSEQPRGSPVWRAMGARTLGHGSRRGAAGKATERRRGEGGAQKAAEKDRWKQGGQRAGPGGGDKGQGGETPAAHRDAGGSAEAGLSGLSSTNRAQTPAAAAETHPKAPQDPQLDMGTAPDPQHNPASVGSRGARATRMRIPRNRK